MNDGKGCVEWFTIKSMTVYSHTDLKKKKKTIFKEAGLGLKTRLHVQVTEHPPENASYISQNKILKNDIGCHMEMRGSIATN